MVAGVMIAASWPAPALCADAQPPAPPWESPLARQAALTGEIRDLQQRPHTDSDTLIERLAAVDFVLLGERHDNRDHHRLQAWITDRLLARGRPYALALEMIDSGQSARLADYLARSPRDSAGLGAALDWKESGWPDWQSLSADCRSGSITGIADPRRQPAAGVWCGRSPRRALRRLPRSLAQNLQLDPDSDSVILKAHAAEIQQAHCGMLPERSLRPSRWRNMPVTRQMARVMVDQWQTDQGKTGVILIAGAGHVRTDRGVPFHLPGWRPQRGWYPWPLSRRATIAMTESDLTACPTIWCG